MNLEILSSNVKTDESHTFSFSKPVLQYMVGFSTCNIEYSRPDHHVKKIKLDLTDVKQSHNEIIVKPQLRIKDISGHNQSSASSVTVNVIAVVGEGNPDIELASCVKGYFKNDLTNENPTILKSCLTYSCVRYSDEDHHVTKYSSEVSSFIKQNYYVLSGKSILRDTHKEHNVDNNKIFGSSIVYNGFDKKVLCANFDSNIIGDDGIIQFGDICNTLDLRDYMVAAFIDGFDVSFKKNSDHHVLKIDLAASVKDEKLFVNNGKICAKVNLKSYLTDNGENQYSIPHNSISGFVLAINKK